MTLLGYLRVKGEKNGKSWDFVNLFIEKDYVQPGSEVGGSIIVYKYSQNRGNYFPSIPYSEFTQLLANGIKPGSNIDVYKDIDDTIHVRLI